MKELVLTPRQRMIAILVAIACFMPPFIGEATNIVIPDMLRGLGYAGPEFGYYYGWILTLYLLTSTVFLIPAARLADKFNKKIFFVIGTLLLGLGSLGIGLSTSGEMILIMRSIEGIGNAMMFGTAIALISSVVKIELRGTAIGIAMTGVFMGQLIGPLLAGLLTESFGWQSVYLILLPVSLFSALLSIPLIPKDSPTDTGKYDWIGAIFFTVGMTLTMYGVSQLPKPNSFLFFILGLVLLTGFVFYERKCTNPLIPIKLAWANRDFSFNNGANLLYYVAIYAMGSLISFFMTNSWDLDTLSRALIVTTQGLILVLFTIIAGKFYDHLLHNKIVIVGAILTIVGIIAIFAMGSSTSNDAWITGSIIAASITAFGIGSVLLGLFDRFVTNAPPKIATVTGLIIIVCGMFVLLSFENEVEIWKAIASQALFGLGIAMFVTPNSTAIMNSVTNEEYGMASGMLSTTRMLGMAISIGIVNVLKNIFDFSAEFMTVFHGMIYAAMVALVIAIILSWFGGNGTKQ